MKKILMVANGNTTFNGFSFLAKELVERRGDFCDILCEKEEIDVERFVKRNQVDTTKVGIIMMKELNAVFFYSGGKLRNAFTKAKKAIALAKIYSTKTKQIKELFDKNKYDEVLVRTDNRVGYEPYVIKEANKRKIPVVVVPMATVTMNNILMNEKNGYKVYKNQKKTFFEILAMLINKDWVVEQEDRLLYFFDPFRLVVTHYLRLMSPMPWIVGCGRSNVVCTATELNYIEACKYLGEKKAWNKYIWTGTVEEQSVKYSLDNKKEIHNSIKENYNLKNDFICIYSDSPLYEVGILDRTHKALFTQVVLETILKRYSEVLISPHPLSDMEFLKQIASTYNVKIMKEPLREVIGAADVNIYPDTSGEDEWTKKYGIPRITFPRRLSFNEITDDSRKELEEKLNGEIESYIDELSIEIRKANLLDVI